MNKFVMIAGLLGFVGVILQHPSSIGAWLVAIAFLLIALKELWHK